MIELVHVQKVFEGKLLLKDVHTTIEKGDVIGVIGPSGSGKSTLLRCINLLDPPTGGQIFVDGEEITARGYDASRISAKLGMVFQKFNLFGHWTAIENIMYPQMDILGRTKQEAYDTAIRLLRAVGLEGKAFSYPRQLSGGQQQRVAICRTLAMDPEIILLDEPTSALDPTKVGEVEEVILGLAETGRTMMIVSHEMRFIQQVANRVFYLDEGVIYEAGTPEQIFDHPVREKTRAFVKRLKSLTIDIVSSEFDFLAAIADIDAYCTKCHLSMKLTQSVQTVFEELCITSLLPYLHGSGLRIRFILEWNEEESSLSAIVWYTGDAFDPRDADNIAWALIEGSTQSVSYELCQEDGFTNKVSVVFPE